MVHTPQYGTVAEMVLYPNFHDFHFLHVVSFQLTGTIIRTTEDVGQQQLDSIVDTNMISYQ